MSVQQSSLLCFVPSYSVYHIFSLPRYQSCCSRGWVSRITTFHGPKQQARITTAP